MIRINVCKAKPCGDSYEIKDQAIIINFQLPLTTSETLDKWEEFYEKQADMINRALSESLPQGTYDRLGIKFMQRKVTLYQGRTGT